MNTQSSTNPRSRASNLHRTAAALALEIAVPRDPAEDLPILTKEALETFIVGRGTHAWNLLQESIVIPVGHEWKDNPLDDRRDVIEMAGWGNLGFRIGKQFAESMDGPERLSDPDQVSVEVRLFLPEQRYRADSIRRFRKHSGPRYGAMLLVKSGPQWAFRYVDQIKDGEQFPKADTLEELISRVSQTVNRALGRAVPERMPAASLS